MRNTYDPGFCRLWALPLIRRGGMGLTFFLTPQMSHRGRHWDEQRRSSERLQPQTLGPDYGSWTRPYPSQIPPPTPHSRHSYTPQQSFPPRPEQPAYYFPQQLREKSGRGHSHDRGQHHSRGLRSSSADPSPLRPALRRPDQYGNYRKPRSSSFSVRFAIHTDTGQDRERDVGMNRGTSRRGVRPDHLGKENGTAHSRKKLPPKSPDPREATSTKGVNSTTQSPLRNFLAKLGRRSRDREPEPVNNRSNPPSTPYPRDKSRERERGSVNNRPQPPSTSQPPSHHRRSSVSRDSRGRPSTSPYQIYPEHGSMSQHHPASSRSRSRSNSRSRQTVVQKVVVLPTVVVPRTSMVSDYRLFIRPYHF